MKVKITSHNPVDRFFWWYRERIGREFEVKEAKLYQKKHERYTITKGFYVGKSILKQDCEVINE